MSVTAARIWAELESAVRDRAHGWRLPVLATVSAGGAPDARTVVLREVQADAGRLTIFTDARSPKVAQLAADARGVFVFWCPRLRWQLRVDAQVAVINAGGRVAATWERLRHTPAAGDYLAPHAPGSRLGAAGTGPGQNHFCLLDAHAVRLDWLSLADAAAHQRILFQDGAAHPLVP